MNEFLMLSRLLTGLPQLAAGGAQSVETRMAQDYLRLVKEQFGAGYDALLVIARSAAAAADPLKAIVEDPGFKDQVENAAKQIVNLWMLSQYTDSGKTFDAGFFEKGSVWPAIKAHAIGFSHSSYGYWASKP